jgi:putative addiction module antidote
VVPPESGQAVGAIQTPIRAAQSRYNVRYNFPELQMATLKVTQIGNSLGVILPKEVAARLKVEKGDQLAYLDTPGGIELTSYDPTFEQKMDAARRVAKRYRNALRELAK